jgi:hypothetical protein
MKPTNSIGAENLIEFVTSVLQEWKRCIFCGNPPSAKNKEHVVPKWLIELTGDPKREWYLGLYFGEPRLEEACSVDDKIQWLRA